MADGDKKGQVKNRITDQQRYRYIGFEVFPGKPKDLFKNDAEKDKYLKGVMAKRESDTTLREECILLEERVSVGERIVLAVSSLAILLALLLPWYSAYMVMPVQAEAVAPTEAVLDSALVAGDEDTLAATAVTEEIPAPTAAEIEQAAARQAAEDAAAELERVAAEQEAANEAAGVTTHAGDRANEQIITARAARARTIQVHSYLTGFGTFASLGSAGAAVFSSGFVLMLTGVLMLILGLLCVALPVINLYSLFGLKGKPDDVAIKLKKNLRLNWLPLILFTVALILSFVGADYGFDVTESFTSIGQGYSVAVFLGSLSWGVFVALAASLLVAVKGIEI